MESSLACSIYLAAQKNMATYTCSLEISCVQATYSLNASLKEMQKIEVTIYQLHVLINVNQYCFCPCPQNNYCPAWIRDLKERLVSDLLINSLQLNHLVPITNESTTRFSNRCLVW